MHEVFVHLESSETVQEFVNTVSNMDGDFELISDMIILDARSLLGIFSLNLKEPLKLRVYNDRYINHKALKRFMVQEV